MKSHLVILMFAALCHAQTSAGIHAPVTRTVNIPADEASFNVTVAAKLDSTARQVKDALQIAGAPNPTVIASSVGGARSGTRLDAPEVSYYATFTLPAANAADVAKALLNLSTHLPEPLTFLQMSVNYTASNARMESVRQSLLPQMRDEAQKAAQNMAIAAGVRLGPVRAASDNPSGYFLVARSGDFSQVTGILSALPAIGYTFRLELVFDTLP